MTTKLEDLRKDLQSYLDNPDNNQGELASSYQLLSRCEDAIAQAIEDVKDRPDCNYCEAIGDSWSDSHSEGLADGIEQAKDALQHAMHTCREKLERWASDAAKRYTDRRINHRDVKDEFADQLTECEELFLREANHL
jgi:hypothetical protein